MTAVSGCKQEVSGRGQFLGPVLRLRACSGAVTDCLHARHAARSAFLVWVLRIADTSMRLVTGYRRLKFEAGVHALDAVQVHGFCAGAALGCTSACWR